METFNKGRAVIFFLVLLSGITLLVSTGTDYWYQSKTDRAVHQGLWKGCIKIGHKIRCYETPDKHTQDWKRASRAMMVIADSSYFFIFIYAIFMCIKKLPSFPIGILLTLTFLFSMIGLSVYTTKSGINRVSGLEFGFSYMCGWCGCALSFIAAILAILEGYNSQNSAKNNKMFSGQAALLRA